LRAAFSAKGDAGLSLLHVSSARYDSEGRAKAIARLLEGPDRPTAVLAISDGAALDFMAAAQARGLSIPDDVSVIGFDNIPAAARVTPGLTTFDARIAESATQLAAMLLARIGAPDKPHEARLLTPKLILRRSHGTAPTT
jgi:LacI family transcriptional regulator